MLTKEEIFYKLGATLAQIRFVSNIMNLDGSDLSQAKDAAMNMLRGLYYEVEEYANHLNINDYPTLTTLEQHSEEFISFFHTDKILEKHGLNIACIYQLGFIFRQAKLRRTGMETISEENTGSVRVIIKEELELFVELLKNRKVNANLISEFNEIMRKFNEKNASLTEDQFDAFENKLTQQMFHPIAAQPRYSEIDKSRPVLNEHWVISLVRKPDDTHSEHAFLIVEGRDDNRALIWFIDFVGEPMLSGMANGKIRIYDYAGEGQEKLLFLCNKQMMNIRRGDRLLYTSWNISKASVQELIKAVTAQKNNPPTFNLLGKNSVFGITTGKASSRDVGHNCFTWAKEKLFDLNLEHIQLPALGIKEWVISATSTLLPDATRYSWYQRPEIIAAMVAGGVGMGITIGRGDTVPAFEAISKKCVLQ
jgi:hypothetical protein